MARHADILDDRDPLTFPFVVAVALHLSIVGVVAFYTYWASRHHDQLGDAHPAGGAAYTVSSVSKIPIPQNDARPNPVANDTKSNVPTAPAKQETVKRIQVPDKNAIEIPDRMKKKQAPQPTHQQKYLPPAPKNQIYSQNRMAASSPMYAAPSGSGQVGIGPNSPLGNRLGWYAEIVRSRIAQQWLTNGLNANSQRQPAVVSFTIMRDGSVRDIRVTQSSGNPNIDNTASRAIYSVGQFPPLPAQVTDSSITAEFTFNLR